MLNIDLVSANYNFIFFDGRWWQQSSPIIKLTFACRRCIRSSWKGSAGRHVAIERQLMGFATAERWSTPRGRRWTSQYRVVLDATQRRHGRLPARMSSELAQNATLGSSRLQPHVSSSRQYQIRGLTQLQLKHDPNSRPRHDSGNVRVKIAVHQLHARVVDTSFGRRKTNRSNEEKSDCAPSYLCRKSRQDVPRQIFRILGRP